MDDDQLRERVRALDEWAVEMAMRASAVEFVVEVMLANRLAARPAGEADLIVEDLASPMRAVHTSQPHVTEASLRAATDRISRHVDDLGRKALQRAADLRAQGPGPREWFL